MVKEQTRRGPIRRFFGFFWRLVDWARRLVQLLVLLLIVALIVASLSQERVTVPDQAALLIEPRGLLVEQLSGDPVMRALAQLQGVELRETLVSDLIAALDAAAEDDRIPVIVLALQDLDGGGLSKLQAVAAAIQRARDRGKLVVAMGDAYTQDQYFLAAHADEVYMHSFGSVFIDGYGYYRAFFRDALDKLRVDVNVFRVGEYKSFVEPFLRDDMSPEDREASQRWLDALWLAWQEDVRAARALPANDLNDYVERFADRVEAADGDLARVAAEAGLVDSLLSRSQFRDYMVELVGWSEFEDGSYSAITHDTYLSAINGQPAEQPPAEANVGVLVAAGNIVDGEAPPGTIGGDSVAALVRGAALDDRIDAVVLRVDSPGGSMFASEVVLEELVALRESGKPLVVSMSSVAASGGYYIAMPADEIWAAPTTITGSIGVGALLPTFQRSLARLGIRIDGIGTTSLSGQLSLEQELGEDARRVLQSSVEDAYRVFVDKVATARDMDFDRADNLARGRVWIGADAASLGLVDQLGGLDDAVASAAALAGLEEGQYGTVTIRREPGFRERLAMALAVRMSGVLQFLGVGADGGLPVELRQLAADIGQDLRLLAGLRDPRGIYYLCPCDLR
ncbi:MAG: signal peptide peptidase SppA [Gammaproteobacteria bacterium]|nr:signal peptide peptidase SppA [Gammaproteobacteria bacterium]